MYYKNCCTFIVSGNVFVFKGTLFSLEGLVYLIGWKSSWPFVRVKCCYLLRGRRGLAGRLYSYWISIKDDEATTRKSSSALEWLVTIQSALMRSAKCDGQLSPPWASPHQPQLNCHGRHKVVCQPFNFKMRTTSLVFLVEFILFDAY